MIINQLRNTPRTFHCRRLVTNNKYLTLCFFFYILDDSCTMTITKKRMKEIAYFRVGKNQDGFVCLSISIRIYSKNIYMKIMLESSRHANGNKIDLQFVGLNNHGDEISIEGVDGIRPPFDPYHFERRKLRSTERLIADWFVSSE